jgi:hypothetical protein
MVVGVVVVVEGERAAMVRRVRVEAVAVRWGCRRGGVMNGRGVVMEWRGDDDAGVGGIGAGDASMGGTRRGSLDTRLMHGRRIGDANRGGGGR